MGGFFLSLILGLILSGGDPLLSWLVPLAFVVAMMMRATYIRQSVRLQLMHKLHQTRRQQPHLTTQYELEEPAYLSTRGEHWCCAIVSNDKRRYVNQNQLAHNSHTNARHDSEFFDNADAHSNFEAPHVQLNLQHAQDYEARLRRQQADFCFRIWQTLAWCCCNACCFSYCQWCGMCATGQEDRELRRLLPASVFYRDYITFEAFGAYYPQIEWLRQEHYEQEHHHLQLTSSNNLSSDSLWKHLGALSQLSRKLLHILAGSLVVLLTAATLHLVANFSLAKVFVVILTLSQAGLILYLVYWRKHKHDISLDAIIKFFASGFVLAMMVAVVVELILDIIGEIIFSIVMTSEFIEDHPELNLDDDYTMNHAGPFANMDTFKTMAQQHYVTLLVYLFFKAVVVAGLVEEMSKYYCFWMVEHPDFIYGPSNTSNSTSSMSGSTHQSQSSSVNQEQESFSSLGDESNFCNDVGARRSGATITTANTTSTASGSHIVPPTSPSESATTGLPPFRPRAAPSHTTAGAMITVGMIATAAGFSCSENLMYVFSQRSVAGGTFCGIVRLFVLIYIFDY